MAHEESKVSVILPIYNVEPYIRQCLDSMIGQTYRNLEIILVDDGSTDNCGVICDEYAEKDDRIVVIHQKNQGVSVARNAGIDAAHGEYVMFVDPDDWLELDCCERVRLKIEEEGCDVLFFQRQEEDEVHKRVKRYSTEGSFAVNASELRRLQMIVVSMAEGAYGFDCLVPWGKIVRLDRIKRNSVRFPVGIKKAQDIIWNAYLLEGLDRAYFYNYTGYHYRRNANSICVRYNPDIQDILMAFLHEMERFVLDYHRGDPEYERSLGIAAIHVQFTIENLSFFHFARKPMARKQFNEYMREYYHDPMVERYIDKCGIGDMDSVKDKVLFLLIRSRNTFIYYYSCVIYKGIKNSVLKLQSARAPKM